jgi:hypothetical protein
MIKTLAIVLLVSAMTLTGCATKTDEKMYASYTKVITEVTEAQLEYFSKQLAALTESIPAATTPLERHLIRQSIMDLSMEVQDVKRSTGTNDVLNTIADKSDSLLRTVGTTLIAYKGLEVLGDIVDSAGSMEADNGSTIEVNKPESHVTTVGDDNTATLRDPTTTEAEPTISE